MNLKKRFLRVYYKLPDAEEKMTICIDEKYGPCSWNVCKNEIDHDTETGRKMLEKLAEMEII